MNLSRKIFSNTFWQVFGRLVTALVGVISIKLITNSMTTSAYGMYTTLFELVGFFAIMADFGLYTICVQQMAEKKHSQEKILANVLSIRLVLIVVTLGLASIAIPLIPKYADTLIAKNVALVSLTTSFALAAGTISSLLQYRLKMIWFSVAQILGKIVTVTGIFIVIKASMFSSIDMLFSQLIWASVVGNLILLGLTYYFVAKLIKIKLEVDRQYIKTLFKHALPYGLALILNRFYFKIDMVFIQWVSGNHQAGIYAVALKLMEIIAVIPVFFMNSALPELTNSFVNNKKRFNDLISKCFRYLSLIGMPIMMGGIAISFALTFIITSPQFLSGYHCSNDIRELHQTQEMAALQCPQVHLDKTFSMESAHSFEYFYGSDVALQIVLVAIFFVFLNSLFGFCLVAMGKQSKLLKINFYCLIFNVLTNLAVIPYYGFVGAALTTVLSEILILFGTYFYVKKFTGYVQKLGETLKIGLISLIMAVAVSVLFGVLYPIMQNIATLVVILFGVVIYVLMALRVGVLDIDEFRKIV